MTIRPPSERPDVERDVAPPPVEANVQSVAAQSYPAEIRFSVVVPTFNERESIERTLDRLYYTSPLSPESFEVIVVDESDDETPKVVRSLDHRNLRLMRFGNPLGLARSVIEGFRAARGEYLGVIDADGQHPPSKLYELFNAAQRDDLDVAIASRYVEDGGIENWSWYRKIVSVGATTIARLLLLGRPAVSDPMSGFFVVRRSLLDDVTLKPYGYKILLDILVRANPGHTGEIGYVFSEREHGTSNLDVTEYLNYLVHVGALCWYRLRN